jgi:uncharacterized membrane protein YhaH (DUF805 family)
MTFLQGLFQGRMSRGAYWLFWVLPNTALWLAWFVFDTHYLKPNFGEPALSISSTASWIVGIFATLIGLTFDFRRFHDSGERGVGYAVVFMGLNLIIWANFAANNFFDREFLSQFRAHHLIETLPVPLNILSGLLFVFAGIALFVWMIWILYRLLIRKGDDHQNQFGPDPLDRGGRLADAALAEVRSAQAKSV